jgi:hypothetical protein
VVLERRLELLIREAQADLDRVAFNPYLQGMAVTDCDPKEHSFSWHEVSATTQNQGYP